MGFNEAIDYIYSLTNLEVLRDRKIPSDGIENVKKILEYLRVDYLSIPIFHVAGTKGKGTVSTILAYLISKKDNKVGLFTSPHLVSITERISTLEDGSLCTITENDFEKIYAEVRKAKEDIKVELTTFDFLTIMAMVFFVYNKVDYIVLEVGLGGRLDSTNFCIPKVCGITLIDYDHTKVLGNTLEEIAYEKCGIIKNGIPVISMYQDDSARRVVVEVSKEKNSNLVFVDDLYEVEEVCVSKEGTFAKVRDMFNGTIFDVSTKLIGEHFIWNVLMAFEMLNKVDECSYEILRDVDPPISGRFEVLSRDPLVVFDVAHTPKSIQSTISTFLEISSKKKELVISLLRDKEIRKISDVLNRFKRKFEKIYVLRIDDPNDGSGILFENLSSLGIKFDVLDTKLEDLRTYDTLFVGSFRTYQLVKNFIV